MSRRIMIFDDDNDILSICSFILESQGWEVFTQSNCNNVLQVVGEVNPDLIVMDNWIPDSGGIVATQTIKSNPSTSHIPVIYFSANHDIKNLAIQAGTEYFLAKPFDIHQFEELIHHVLQAHSS
ncbi:MAG: response regulator [Chitinophagaceae bacterium]|nr:response regulator [Chitinophagaceae bacterium]